MCLTLSFLSNWGVHAVVPKKVFEPYNLVDLGSDEVATGRQATLSDADIALSADSVHWGYFSKELEPILTVTSGQEVSNFPRFGDAFCLDSH